MVERERYMGGEEGQRVYRTDRRRKRMDIQIYVDIHIKFVHPKIIHRYPQISMWSLNSNTNKNIHKYPWMIFGCTDLL